MTTLTTRPPPGRDAGRDVHVCPLCRTENRSGDVYCIGCGATLEPEPGAPDEQPAADEQPAPTRPRRRPGIMALAVAAFATTGAAVALGVLWRGEAGHSRDLSAQAVAAGTELAVARKQLAATRVQLRSATTVGARRNTVLLRTQTVLAQVDPLLSTADEIQRYTAHIQGERDWFTTSVVQLVTDLTVLGNYLLETDPAAVDPVRQRAFVEAVKDDLDSVRRDEATLHAFDKSYDGASTRFGRRADAFTKAVRALQQQLKSVAVK